MPGIGARKGLELERLLNGSPPRPLPGLLKAKLRERYLDTLASVYIYNEHRGYTSLDRVLEAVRAFCPDDPAFIAEIVSHRADEEKHYHMFRRWFELRGRMPLAVDRTCGHIDRFIERIFGCTIEQLDTRRIIAEPGEFERLCRVIMLTEQRGYQQLAALLRNPAVLSDPVLTRIFRIIHKDEPSHFLPYQHWLERHGKATANRRERLTDFTIHKSLMLAKLPSVFANPTIRRLQAWPHVDSRAYQAP
jgi:hypothetical protein